MQVVRDLERESSGEIPTFGTVEPAAGVRRGRRPPMIRTLPVVGPVRELTGDVMPFLNRMRQEYGDVFRFPLFGREVICMGGDGAIAILRNDELLGTAPAMRVLQRALKSRLPMTFTGPQHPVYRKMHMRFVNRRLERANRATIVGAVEKCTRGWSRGHTFTVLDETQLQTVHILSLLLNYEEFPFTREELSLVVHTTFLATYGHVPMWLAFSNPRYRRVLRKMEAHFLELVGRVRRDPELASKTLIGQYLNCEPPTGCVEWDDEDLKIVPLIAYLAGFDTVASASGFFLYRLLSHPEWLERVRQEYRELPTDEHGNVDPNDQVVLDAVFQETMRFNPPGAMVIRHATRDFEFKGYRIRKGDEVILQISTDHMNERLFPNPQKFDPSRFLSETPSPLCKHVRTFGAGAHRCTGRVLGPLIAKEMVSLWVNRFDLELHPRHAKPRVTALPFTQPMNLKVRVRGPLAR